jgi:hypothetical protein
MFNNEEILLNHIKFVHTNEILIQCLECRSRFSSKWNLIRHMKLLHTNIKHDDDDKSPNPMNLTPKILIKKFSCSFCHIKFGCIDTLKQHMMNYCSSRPMIKENSYPTHKLYYFRDEKKKRMFKS